MSSAPTVSLSRTTQRVLFTINFGTITITFGRGFDDKTPAGMREIAVGEINDALLLKDTDAIGRLLGIGIVSTMQGRGHMPDIYTISAFAGEDDRFALRGYSVSLSAEDWDAVVDRMLILLLRSGNPSLAQ